MYEVAAGAVGTEADSVIRAAPFSLVLGVAGQIAQLVSTMRELTLVAVLAMSALFERPTQFRFVARRVYPATTTTVVTVQPVVFTVT